MHVRIIGAIHNKSSFPVWYEIAIYSNQREIVCDGPVLMFKLNVYLQFGPCVLFFFM